MKLLELPSYETIREIFSYDEATGNLIWKKHRHSYLIGKIAGSLKKSGYVCVGINGSLYKLHRIIWVYHHGGIPEKHIIDHINGIPSDNRIENLRLCDHSSNNFNARVCLPSKLGLKGVRAVSLKDDTIKYVSEISIRKKRISLGTFNTIFEAFHAYVETAKKHHGEFFRMPEMPEDLKEGYENYLKSLSINVFDLAEA